MPDLQEGSKEMAAKINWLGLIDYVYSIAREEV